METNKPFQSFKTNETNKDIIYYYIFKILIHIFLNKNCNYYYLIDMFLN